MAGLQHHRIEQSSAAVLAASLRALSRGGRVNPPSPADPTDCGRSVSVRYAGRCKAPRVVVLAGIGPRPEHTRVVTGAPFGRALVNEARARYDLALAPDRDLWMEVRCRRCDGCRKERRCMWANRAVSEWNKAAQRGGRTWFVTLTFRPEEHYRLQTMTRQRLASQGADLDAMSWDDQYRELLTEYHAELTCFLKRVRVGLATRGWKRAHFRYLAVPEPHKGRDIRLHYHLLLHEAADPKSGEVVPIVRRRIEQAWRGDFEAAPSERGPRARRDLGFVVAKLVESPGGALYATKYLGKHHYEGRIRNSHEYGAEGDTDPEAELREPAVPPPVVERRQAEGPPAAGGDTRAMQVAMIESAEEDDDTEPVRVGDYLGVCPSGLHIGTGCGCEPEAGSPECVPAEFDELRGTPRRKWPLRGWHEPGSVRGPRKAPF